MLTKATVQNPYNPPNSYQAIPAIFINQKMYGKSTNDDPVNNINVVRNKRIQEKIAKQNKEVITHSNQSKRNNFVTAS